MTDWTACVEAVAAACADRVGNRGVVEVDTTVGDGAVYIDVTPHTPEALAVNIVIDGPVLTFVLAGRSMSEIRAGADDDCDSAVSHVMRYVDAAVAGGSVEHAWWRGRSLVRVVLSSPAGERLGVWGWPLRPLRFFTRKTQQRFVRY